MNHGSRYRLRAPLTAAVSCVIAVAGAPGAHSETPRQHVNVCYALRHGESVADIELRLIATGYTEYGAGALAGRMLRDNCPDQIDNVERQVGFQ